MRVPYLPFILLLFILGTACKKVEIDATDVQQDYFYKQYSVYPEASETYQYVIPHENGVSAIGHIRHGSRNSSSIFSEINSSGYTVSDDIRKYDDEVTWVGNEYSPGLYILNSAGGSEFVLRDQNGTYTETRNIQSTTLANLDTYIASRCVQGEDGTFYTAYCDAIGSGFSDSLNRYIIGFDEMGNEVSSVEIPSDSVIPGGTIMFLEVDKVDANSIYISGNCTRAPFRTFSYMQNFVAVYDRNSKTFTSKAFGPANSFGEWLVDRAITSDARLHLNHTWYWKRGNNSRAANPSMTVRKLEHDGSLIWETEVTMESVRLLPVSIEPCIEGYIIGGFAILSGSESTVPFFVILDHNGEVKKKHYFYELSGIWIYQAVMTDERDIYICGANSIFGKHKESDVPILIKCDMDGNYSK